MATINPEYINNLDVWVVSHGGCGSNYIVDLLEENNYKVRDKPRYESNAYGRYCHLSFIPEGVDFQKIKILYIYGDIVNSMCSQESRGLLRQNVDCLQYESSNSSYLWTDDPFNYLNQYDNFNNDNVVKLKYPFTHSGMVEAFEKLNITITTNIEAKERTKTYAAPYPSRIKEVIDKYKDSVLQ